MYIYIYHIANERFVKKIDACRTEHIAIIEINYCHKGREAQSATESANRHRIREIRIREAKGPKIQGRKKRGRRKGSSKPQRGGTNDRVIRRRVIRKSGSKIQGSRDRRRSYRYDMI